MEVGTFEHTAFTSRFSGNVIELCPVGALLSRTYRFKARPWDLLTQRSICTQCSNGCNIKLDYRVSKLQRVNARINEAVNEEWTCDKGKFGMDYVSSDARLKVPLVRRGDRLEEASWEEANRIIADRLKTAAPHVGGIGGARASNEDLYVWQRLFRSTLESSNLDHRMGPNFPETGGGLFRRFGYHTMGNSIAELEKMKSIFVIGSDLAEEQPIIFLRVRKAWRFLGASVVEANPAENNVSEFASVSLRYRPGSEISLVNGLISVMLAENLLPGEQSSHARGLAPGDPSSVASETGVPEESLRQAARLLATGQAAIVAGRLVSDHRQAEDLLAALGNLAILTGNAGNINLPVQANNQQGAMDMGILPDSGPGYEPVEKPGLNSQQMLEAAATGRLQALWLVGTDLVNEYHDPSLARQALEACPFVVVNELFLTETAQLADVVLPVQSVAERDGTYTNAERRIQPFYKAFEIAPTIHPDWLVFAEVEVKLGGRPPYFSSGDIVRDIAAHVPIYAGCLSEELHHDGIRWEYSPVERPAPGFESLRQPAPART
jgi:NADH-quinone oxidoreductase subunit G